MKTIENIPSHDIAKANITSGENVSFWLASAQQPLAFETLGSNAKTDVLVVGGGIAGLTTAYCLAKEGLGVVLVEDGYLGSGETGRTTAHLSNALDDHYSQLEKTFDKATAKLAAESHSAAIEWIAETVLQHSIDCHFRRVDGYLFAHPSDSSKTLKEEFNATQRAGLSTEMLDGIPSILELSMIILFEIVNTY